MNLKDAFHGIKQLNTTFTHCLNVLRNPDNFGVVTINHLLSRTGLGEDFTETVSFAAANVSTVKSRIMRSWGDCEDEADNSKTYYGDAYSFARVIAIANAVLAEKEALCEAVAAAKKAASVDYDLTKVNNVARRAYMDALSVLDSGCIHKQNKSEMKNYLRTSDGQSDTYPIVKDCNYNVNKTVLRQLRSKLAKSSQASSAEIDRMLVTAEVTFTPSFDYDLTFEQLYQSELFTQVQ